MNIEAIKSKFERYVMGTYSRYPVAVERGEGSWLWDADGKRYLDFTTGIAVSGLGHCHPAIVQAVKEQVDKVIHTSNLFYIEPQVELAEMLVKNSFADKAFFCNTGTEANEAAIKLARKWGKSNGSRYKCVAALGSFHGRTLGALSATGKRIYQRGFNPLVPGFKFVPYGNLDAMDMALRDDRVCAVILEPIQGENGVVLPPEGYLSGVRELCSRRGVLLILDEIQVGMGRTGRLFCYEHEGIEPDIVTLAKSLAGGIPAAAVLARDDVAIHFTPGSHGSTFGGNPLAMRAACAYLNAVISGGVLDNVTKMGGYFLDGLLELSRCHPRLVKEARGKGLILGIELFSGKRAREIHRICIEKGFLFILTVEKVIRLLPPLNVTKEEIDFALNTLGEAFKEAA